MGALTGPVVTAGDNWGRFKSNQTNRVSTTTLTDDPELFFTINATGTITFRCDFTCVMVNTTMGFQFTIGYTGTYTGGFYLFNYVQGTTSAASNNGTMGTGTAINPSTTLTGVQAFGGMVASSSGVLSFKWAQTSANGSNLVVYPGATLNAWKSAS